MFNNEAMKKIRGMFCLLCLEGFELENEARFLWFS